VNDNTPPPPPKKKKKKKKKQKKPGRLYFCVRVYINQNVFVKAYNILRYSPIINEVLTCV